MYVINDVNENQKAKKGKKVTRNPFQKLRRRECSQNPISLLSVTSKVGLQMSEDGKLNPNMYLNVTHWNARGMYIKPRLSELVLVLPKDEVQHVQDE